MKKIYNAPEASLLCFRPVEDLAIAFEDLVKLDTLETKQGTATEISENDITITF